MDTAMARVEAGDAGLVVLVVVDGVLDGIEERSMSQAMEESTGEPVSPDPMVLHFVKPMSS